MNIIFFGTPEIAAYCLKIIYQSNHKVLAVVTAPDKPAGRGKKIKESAVKKFALQNDIKIFQPTNLKSDDFENELKKLNPDLAVVVAFRMLPKKIWTIPKKGTINLHASLLPDYRGAAPINHVIINGEKQTGITTFFINENIDTGSILMQEKIPIDQKETAGSLHDKIMTQGAQLLLKTLDLLQANKLTPTPQESLTKNSNLHSAPKLTKENTKINWNNTIDNIYNFVRGLSPYPGAWTIFQTDTKQATAKMLFVEKEKAKHNLKAGQAIIENKKLKIAAKDGFIIPEQIIPQGKKLMSGKDFLNGLKFNEIIFL